MRNGTEARWVDFLGALLDPDRARAEQVARDALVDGMRGVDVVERVVTPALHEVGRLWEVDAEAGVAVVADLVGLLPAVEELLSELPEPEDTQLSPLQRG